MHNFFCPTAKIRSKIFSGSGDLKIKCTAAIDPIYWRSSEESIQVIMVMIMLIIINNGDHDFDSDDLTWGSCI